MAFVLLVLLILRYFLSSKNTEQTQEKKPLDLLEEETKALEASMEYTSTTPYVQIV